jgi:hypothetical protein
MTILNPNVGDAQQEVCMVINTSPNPTSSFFQQFPLLSLIPGTIYHPRQENANNKTIRVVKGSDTEIYHDNAIYYKNIDWTR